MDELNDVLQNIFKYFEVKNNRIIEKASLLDQSASAYSHFMKEFSMTMTKIVEEFKLVNEILINNKEKK